MKELFFAILFFTILAISCKDESRETNKEIRQEKIEIDSISSLQIFMDGKLLSARDVQIQKVWRQISGNILA